MTKLIEHLDITWLHCDLRESFTLSTPVDTMSMDDLRALFAGDIESSLRDIDKLNRSTTPERELENAE